jgi:hypothetical protein
MAIIRRYWIAALVLVLVITHVSILGYVRSQIARLKNVKSTTVEIGDFRFQPLQDPSSVYACRLHAVLTPRLRLQGEELISQYRIELHEMIEHTLRQVDQAWLSDPEQAELKLRLKDLVAERLNQPLVDRVVIVDWMKLPVATLTPLSPAQP